MAEQKMVICPYCGDAQALAERCRACGGLFEPLSRQATHNAMGPWFVRDVDRPFQPGCSYETLLRLVERGRVTRFTIVRGPTTRQFWTIAKHVPGLSHLLGYCHQCDASVDAGDHACHACGAAFGAYMDRNYLGLPEVRPLPWEAETDNDVRPTAPRSPMPMWRSSGEENEPRTISSFVSDAELLGSGEHSGDSLPSSFGGEPTAQRTAPAAVATRTQPQTSTITKRTARPSSSKHRLPMTVVVAGGMVIVALMVVVVVNFMNQPHAVQQEPVAVESEPEVMVPELPRHAEPDDASLDPRDSTPSTSLEELRRGYERALGLLESAEDDQRELSARIAEYQEALKLLEAMKAGADETDWPEDLQLRIERTRVELDRLRLRKFFP